MGSAHIERGYADGQPIAFVSKTYVYVHVILGISWNLPLRFSYSVWQNWIGFEPEVILYRMTYQYVL